MTDHVDLVHHNGRVYDKSPSELQPDEVGQAPVDLSPRPESERNGQRYFIEIVRAEMGVCTFFGQYVAFRISWRGCDATSCGSLDGWAVGEERWHDMCRVAATIRNGHVRGLSSNRPGSRISQRRVAGRANRDPRSGHSGRC